MIYKFTTKYKNNIIADAKEDSENVKMTETKIKTPVSNKTLLIQV